MVITGETQICIGEEELILSAGRAVFWPKEKMLLVADLHLGKSAHFRQFGIPVPQTLLESDLERLGNLIEQYQPKTLLVAGDMFHKDFNTDIEYFTHWRQLYSNMNIWLVQGNHDRLHVLQYRFMQIDIYKPNLQMSPFSFVHEEPKNPSAFFTISGHVHPGVVLRGGAKQVLKLPCFRLSAHSLILPAFSLFTGLDTSRCANDCDYFAIAANEVVLVKNL